MTSHIKAIIDHAKESSKNMQIAILAGLAFVDLRKEIISKFANDLQTKIEDKGWTECNVSDWKNGEWAKFRKTGWPSNIYVGIGPDRNFSRTIFSVIAPNFTNQKKAVYLVDTETRKRISYELNSKYRQGSLENYCVWAISLNEDYANLNSVAGLMALFNEKAALNDLVEKIETVGNVLDSIFQK